MSDEHDEDVEMSVGDDTFSTIHTPNARRQHEHLKLAPPMGTQFHEGLGSQMNQKSMYEKLRKPLGIVDIEYTFKHIFMKSEFKGKQREVMDAAIGGLDVLVIAPTGMGKSICFQVPAVAEEHGLTIVITPLLSLMTNQIQSLEALNIKAAMLTSKTSDDDKKRIEADIMCGHPRIRLLYITPERLAMPKFQHALAKVNEHNELARLVIDEAHCISEWGHNFRKEYQQIGKFRELFPNVPIMALTASATKKVQDDIVLSLDMRTDLLYRVVHSFNRGNLFYEVRYIKADAQEKLNDISSFVHNMYKRKQRRDADLTDNEARSICGIVYCRTKNACDWVSEGLRKKGINAAPYHRGMKDADADRNADLWRNAQALARDGKKRVDCIVATVAFGMGIDTPNCRYIIHFDIPTSFEGYYQETGRAGRDGHASRCLLYYSKEDAASVQSLVKKGKPQGPLGGGDTAPGAPTKGATSSLSQLIRMLENARECRHIAICRYFGEKPKSDVKESYCRKFCDVCKSPEQTLANKLKFIPDEPGAEQEMSIVPSIVVDEPEPTAANESMEDIEEKQATNAELSRHDSSGSDGVSAASLPGFEKASKVAKKGQFKYASGETSETAEVPPADPAPSMQEDGIPLDGLFGATADQLVEDSVISNRPRKRPSAIPDEEDESFETDEGAKATGSPIEKPSATMEAQAMLDDMDDIEEAEIEKAEWEPKRRPSKVIGSQRATEKDEPMEMQADSEFKEPLKRKSAVPDSDDEELPSIVITLPRAPSPKKTAHNRPTPATVVSLVAPRTSLGSGSHGFQAPFKTSAMPATNARLTPIENIPSGSDLKFTLVPAQYTKKVSQEIRREAIRQLYGLLAKAFLASTGNRAKSEEANLMKAVRYAADSKDGEKASVEDIMLYSALEIESDAFWQAITSNGFKAIISKRTAALLSITKTSAWMSAFPASDNPLLAEIFQAMQRAVKYWKVHNRTQRGAAASSLSDGESSD